MIQPILCILLGAICQVGSTPKQPLDRKVQGLLLVSDDPSCVKKVSEGFLYGMPYTDFSKKFDNKRFLVKEWGKRSAILIDLQSGVIGQREKECSLTESLAKSIGSDMTIKLGDLDDAGRSGLMASMQRSPVFPSGFDSSTATVGIGAYVRFSIKGNGGSSDKSFDLEVHNDVGKQRDDALSQHPLKFLQPSDIEQANTMSKDLMKALESSDSLRLKIYGVASNNLPEGLEIVSKLLEEIYQELKLRKDKATLKMLAKLIPHGSNLGDHVAGVNQLPSSLGDQLSRTFGQSWQDLGFSSRADAENYLSGAQDISLSTVLAYRYCGSAGDRAAGVAKSFFDIQVNTVPGGISP